MRKHRSAGWIVQVLPMFGVVALIGCVEPPYRNEVTATGQGGVVVTHAPKTGEAGARPAAVDSAQDNLARHVEMEERIHALESQVQARDAEIEKLKHSSPAATEKNP